MTQSNGPVGAAEAVNESYDSCLDRWPNRENYGETLMPGFNQMHIKATYLYSRRTHCDQMHSHAITHAVNIDISWRTQAAPFTWHLAHILPDFPCGNLFSFHSVTAGAHSCTVLPPYLYRKLPKFCASSKCWICAACVRFKTAWHAGLHQQSQPHCQQVTLSW